MVNELCMVKLCKECPEQLKCFGCDHNYILIKQGMTIDLYKCSKCGKVVRQNKGNVGDNNG